VEYWKTRPQANEIEKTFTLSSFVGENFIIVTKLNATLDSYKERVLYLQEYIRQQRIQIEDEFKQTIVRMTNNTNLNGGFEEVEST